MSAAGNQVEGTTAIGKGGAKPTNGCGAYKLRKQTVTPSPSDKGSSKNGKG